MENQPTGTPASDIKFLSDRITKLIPREKFDPHIFLEKHSGVDPLILVLVLRDVLADGPVIDNAWPLAEKSLEPLSSPGVTSLHPLKDPPKPNTIKPDKKPGGIPLSEGQRRPSDRANFKTDLSSRGPLPSEAIFVRCPFCDDDCVDIEAVKVNRGGEITEITHHGTEMKAGKPAGRGSLIEIGFWCESGHTWLHSLYFCKGNTSQDNELLYTVHDGPVGCLNNELWRD